MPPLSLRGENLRGRNFTREVQRKGQDFLRGADLREADLRGATLRGLDLSGADLHGAQLQGADFRRATLAGANLQQAVAGVRRRTSAIKGVVGLLCAALAGFMFTHVLIFFPRFRHQEALQPWRDLVAAIYGGLILLQLILLVRRGVFPALGAGLAFSAIAIASAIASAGAGAIAITSASTGAIADTIAIADAIASAIASASASAITGASAGAGTVDHVVMTLLGMSYVAALWYTSRRAWQDDPRFALLRRVGLWGRCWLGTNFTQADLSKADLTGAWLQQSWLRGATLHQTCLLQARELQYAQDKDTLLADHAVRQLLVTGAGQGGAYARKDLRGAYLVDANLRAADLTEADVSGAALSQADLRHANLTKLQAIGADFTGANLTGACVESWNIDHTTQLAGVVCEYVYLLGEQGERRPASGQFGPGEFTKLFEEVFHTVDLIFRDGIDWQALLATLQHIRQQATHAAAEVRVQGIEDKGDGVFVVRVHAPPGMSKERLHADLIAGYKEQLAILEARSRAELAGRDNLLAEVRHHNASLVRVVEHLARQQVIVHAGGGNMQVDDHRRQVYVGRDNTGQLNVGDHSVQVAESIRNLPETDATTQTVKQHLEALRRLLDAEATLSDTDKTEALQQVHTLARAATEPQAPAAKARASTVRGWFTQVLPTLTGSQKFLAEVFKLVDVVSKFFGAADAGD